MPAGIQHMPLMNTSLATRLFAIVQGQTFLTQRASRPTCLTSNWHTLNTLNTLNMTLQAHRAIAAAPLHHWVPHTLTNTPFAPARASLRHADSSRRAAPRLAGLAGLGCGQLEAMQAGLKASVLPTPTWPPPPTCGAWAEQQAAA